MQPCMHHPLSEIASFVHADKWYSTSYHTPQQSTEQHVLLVLQEVSARYGVLIEKSGIDLRGLFIINPEGVIEQITMNNLGIGRNVDEAKRLVQAIQFVAEHGEVWACQEQHLGMQCPKNGVAIVISVEFRTCVLPCRSAQRGGSRAARASRPAQTAAWSTLARKTRMRAMTSGSC